MIIFAHSLLDGSLALGGSWPWWLLIFSTPRNRSRLTTTFPSRGRRMAGNDQSRPLQHMWRSLIYSVASHTIKAARATR
jgi:hypothetical protein